nr:HNH endonuclease signature motif containing protein [Corynebacterium lactis]
MTTLGLLGALASRGIDLLADLRAALPEKSTGLRELAADIGFDPFRLKRLLRCADRLFAPLDDAADVLNRDAAVAAARELGLSLDTVMQIDKRCGQINNVDIREENRLDFTRAAGRYDFDALDAYMRGRVKELNDYTEPPQHLRAHVSRKPDIRGMKHLQVTGPANMIDDLVAPLVVRAAEIAKAHEGYSHDRCVGQALHERLAHGGAGPVDAVDKLRYQPALIITAQDIAEYRPRYAATSNGSVLTPGQFIEALLADTGWALVYDENNQPTDLLPIHNPRLATEDQRIAMILDNPICAWPGCTRPSHAGQAHHIVARKNGGATTMETWS